LILTLVKRGAEYLSRFGLLLIAMDKTRRRGGFGVLKETRLGNGATCRRRVVKEGRDESDGVSL
jgi:hypothetical protein